MTDPIALLQRAAAEVAESADLTPDPVAAVRSRVDRDRRGRRLRVAAVAAAVVVVLAGAAALVTTGNDEEDGVVVSPDPTPSSIDPTTTAPTTAPTAINVEPDPVERSPLSRRTSPVVVPLTGGAQTSVVVWGGTDGAGRPLDDGAVYHRLTQVWETLAPSPLAGRPDEGMAPVAAAGRSGVVVVRGRTAAAWSRPDGSWTTLDDLPAIATDLTSIGGTVVSVSANVMLDPDSSSWLPLGDLPVPLSRPTAASTGSELVAIGGSPDGEIVALVLDPAALTWRQASAAPDDVLGDAAVSASWDGGRVVVTAHDMRAATFDPTTDAWTGLPDVPARYAEHHPTTTSIGGLTATDTARALVVLVGDAWIPLPAPDPSPGGGPPGRHLLPVDGTTVATWITAGPNDPDLVFTDLTIATSLDPRRLQVGAASVTLGAGDEVLEATYEMETDGVRVGIAIADDGGSCWVTSVRGRPQGTNVERAVEEEVPLADGSPKIWFHDEAGQHWETELGDQDLLTVECEEPTAARRLVETVRSG